MTCHTGQVVNDFDLPDIIFDLPEISYNIYARKAVIVYHGFRDLKTIFFSVLLQSLHISGYLGHLL